MKGKLFQNTEVVGMLNESVPSVTYFVGRVRARVQLSVADDTAVAVWRRKQVALLVDSALPDFRRSIVIKVVPYCCIKFQFLRRM